MKIRIISSIVGLAILSVILLFFDTIVLNAAAAGIAIMAVFELLVATKYIQNKLIAGLCLFAAGITPFLSTEYFERLIPAFFLVFILVFFVVLVKQHDQIRIESMALSSFIALMIPLSLSTLIWLRDNAHPDIRLLYFLLALGGAWLSDAGAYFAGVNFGKHPLAPSISPKKTVEGAVGGVIVCMVMFIFIAAIYSSIMELLGVVLQVNYLLLALLGIGASIMSIFGDLSASIVKRQCAIKDFGNIMPGHGGVLDRFDSVLFAAPFVYVFTKYLPIVIVK